MQPLKSGTKAWLLSSALLFSSPILAGNADAAQHNHRSGHLKSTIALHAHPIGTRLAQTVRITHGVYYSRALHRAGARFGAQSWGMRSWGVSCVPYARQATGIMVPGNAWQWWDNAEGLYARGDRPEPGSVLNFRANGRMRLGHVAVVTRVKNAREVIVDQANWPSAASGRGGVSHNVAVVDVSEANNWTAVRVELSRDGEFGSVYPTYGFIYNRPDTGYITASITRPTPQPEINRVPSDLRPVAERPWHTAEEIAEAPAATRPVHRIDFSIDTAPITVGR